MNKRQQESNKNNVAMSQLMYKKRNTDRKKESQTERQKDRTKNKE